MYNKGQTTSFCLTFEVTLLYFLMIQTNCSFVSLLLCNKTLQEFNNCCGWESLTKTDFVCSPLLKVLEPHKMFNTQIMMNCIDCFKFLYEDIHVQSVNHLLLAITTLGTE